MNTDAILSHEALRNAAQCGLLPRNGPLTAALSGGADSVALLLILYHLQPQFGYSLQAVHIHHGIRGDEADRDAAFCQVLCRRYSIPLQCRYVDAPAFADSHRLSLETAARQLRYEALEQAAPEGLIATAHHADDQAETLLFYLTRGCGLNGLCGIPPKRGRIIRPLLSVSKQLLLDFLRTAGQDFVIDSTNLTDDGSRNFLRHRVMPLLTEQNAACLRHMSRTAAILSEDADYLEQQANMIYTQCLLHHCWGLKHLEQYHSALRLRCYRLLLAHYEIDPSYDILTAIDALLMQQQGRITVRGNVYAQVHRGILYILRDLPPLHEVLPLQQGENRLFADRICTATVRNALLSPKIHKTFTKSALDYDKIVGKPCFRQWRRDDRIALPKRGCTGKLRNYIQTAVPIPERRTLYALYDDLGCIWCEQVGIAARVLPHADTHRLLVLECSAAQTKSTIYKE